MFSVSLFCNLFSFFFFSSLLFYYCSISRICIFLMPLPRYTFRILFSVSPFLSTFISCLFSCKPVFSRFFPLLSCSLSIPPLLFIPFCNCCLILPVLCYLPNVSYFLYFHSPHYFPSFSPYIPLVSSS